MQQPTPPDTPPRGERVFDIESTSALSNEEDGDDREGNVKAWWDPSGWKVSPFVIIPPMFIHKLGGSFGGSAFAQFLILTVCKQLGEPTANSTTAANAWLNSTSTYNNTLNASRNPLFILSQESGSGELPDYKTCASRSDVQSTTAQWSQIIGLISSVPAFLLLPLMGRLIDRLGRRTMMIIPVVATIIDSISVLSVAYADLSLWAIVFSNLLQGLMGGYGVLIMAGYAFIADTSTAANRTQAFLLLDITSFIAFTLGPFFGGVLYRKTGLITVYIIVLVMDIFALLYLYFVMPETVKTAQRRVRANQTISEPISSLLWNHLVKSWTGCLDILNTPGRGNSLLILALVQAMSSMAAAGYEYTFFFYPAQKFGWDAYDYGVYSMSKSFCRLFYLSIILPSLLRSFAKTSNLVVKTRYELMIIRYGYFMFCFGLICHGLATEGWMFYPLMLFYTGGSMAGPAIRGIASRSVPESSQGSLFAAFELLQNGTSLISEVFIPFIYRALVKMDTPEYMFFVQASFWAVALYFTSYLKSRELVGIVELAGEEDDEEQPFLPHPSTGPWIPEGIVEGDDGAGTDVDGDGQSTRTFRSLRQRSSLRGVSSMASLRSRFTRRTSTSISAAAFYNEIDMEGRADTPLNRWMEGNVDRLEGLENAVDEVSKELRM
ncbi:UNVERIFIED_CONTAM: hypothetical protein HDU68_001741 [Siphonaria sp. JEL0065]|nr:hypothetical protein HDU68_001741 [Siphonaria sp. JEL0065]